MENLYGKVFIKSNNLKNVLILNTTRECLKIKQRGNENKLFKFVKNKYMIKNYKGYILYNVKFYNKCKL